MTYEQYKRGADNPKGTEPIQATESRISSRGKILPLGLLEERLCRCLELLYFVFKTSDAQDAGLFAWSPIAESINGRSAIAGLLIALLI